MLGEAIDCTFGLKGQNITDGIDLNAYEATPAIIITVDPTQGEIATPTPEYTPTPSQSFAPTIKPTAKPTLSITKVLSPRPTVTKAPAVKRLLGGVVFTAKGMPISIYNQAYAPVRVDIDSVTPTPVITVEPTETINGSNSDATNNDANSGATINSINSLATMLGVRYSAVIDENYTQSDINLTKFYRYYELENFILNLGKSKNAEVFKIGESADGRNIYSLQLGSGSQRHLFTAGVHGREIANPLYILKYAAWVLNQANAGNAEIINMLKAKRICIIAVASPDGFEAAQWGNASIKNRSLFLAKFSDSQLATIRVNANGVELNRNFPSYSGGVIYNQIFRIDSYVKAPDLLTFNGYTLGIEPETKAMIKWFKFNLPSARTFVDLHSGGRIIYAGKDHLSNQLNANCLSLANIVNKYTGYDIVPASDSKPGQNESGTTTDFVTEFTSGFVFNEKLGRLVPPNADIYTLVRKYSKIKYSCKTVTIETLVPQFTASKDPAPQAAEWSARKIQDMLYAICKS
jgi:hypothetical protein